MDMISLNMSSLDRVSMDPLTHEKTQHGNFLVITYTVSLLYGQVKVAVYSKD